MTQEEIINKLNESLGISRETYAEIVFDTGLKFLDHITRNDTVISKEMAETSIYWTWFKNQFELIDMHFIATHLNEVKVHTPLLKKALFKTWLWMHKPTEMKAFPNQKMFAKAYDRMFQNMVESKMSKV